MADTILNVAQGDTVDFSSTGIGDIVGYSWSFPGGTPTGITGDSSPSVEYTNVGTFDVSLTTEDAYGVFSTDLKSGIIEVDAAPWDVTFTISGNPVLMGESTDLTNTSIGAANYNEWTFPTDGVIPSGITANSQISVNGLRYMNWNILTGSHSGIAGGVFTTSTKLFATSDYALGSEINLINIKKLGPEEYYIEEYDYGVGVSNYKGKLKSTAYGNKTNANITTGATSAGLTYTYVTDPDVAGVNEYEYPTYYSNGAVIYQVNFNDDFASTYYGWSGITGPTGPYYPHADGEKAEIFGRAFSAFNTRESRYVGSESYVYAAVGGVGSGKTIGDNISIGKYTSDIKSPAPVLNEIVNPEFALILDNYKSSGVSDFDKSYLTHYIEPSVVTTQDTSPDVPYIPKQTIDKLFEHPKRLPDPNTSTDATIGITTSADAHLGANQRINSTNGYARSYKDTGYVRTVKMLNGATNITEIGRYPGIPSTYLLPFIPSQGLYLNNEYSTIWNSTYPPMGLRIRVTYEDQQDNKDIDVYFGLPDPATLASRVIEIPDLLNPNGIVGPDDPTESATAYGNDALLGSWILAEDTVYGIGVASYINAYIADATPGLGPRDDGLGLANGTDELIAKVDDYYTLPIPYSTSTPGTIVNSVGPNTYPGISLEIKNPAIVKVECIEIYSMVRTGGFYGNPMYDYQGVGDPLMMNTPITWDFGMNVPSGENPNVPPYVGNDIGDWINSDSTYMGISSRIIPFSSGPLGYGTLDTFGNPINSRDVGIKIGGELKT